MKKLYLIRHAKSSWKDMSLEDFDRPLNKRGKKDAPLMGKILREYNITPDLVISSPAKRAIITAKIISEEIGYEKEKIREVDDIYEASSSELLNIVKSLPDDSDTIMIFGHNPGLTLLSNYISNREIDNIPTCGVVCIIFGINSWGEIDHQTGRMEFFIYPKKFK
ncbi:MAG: phosphohistidine phosphatase SixA [Ignavibacteriaceae bacterium]